MKRGLTYQLRTLWWRAHAHATNASVLAVATITPAAMRASASVPPPGSRPAVSVPLFGSWFSFLLVWMDHSWRRGDLLGCPLGARGALWRSWVHRGAVSPLDRLGWWSLAGLRPAI